MRRGDPDLGGISRRVKSLFLIFLEVINFSGVVTGERGKLKYPLTGNPHFFKVA